MQIFLSNTSFMSSVEVNKVSCELSQVPDLWFFEIVPLLKAKWKETKYLNTGIQQKTHRRHTLRWSTASPGHSKNKPRVCLGSQEHPHWQTDLSKGNLLFSSTTQPSEKWNWGLLSAGDGCRGQVWMENGAWGPGELIHRCSSKHQP